MTATLDTNVAKKSARRPQPPDRKPMVVQVRGSEAYKTWAERLAAHDGLPLSTVVDRALRRYAKEIGFPDDPPSR